MNMTDLVRGWREGPKTTLAPSHSIDKNVGMYSPWLRFGCRTGQPACERSPALFLALVNRSKKSIQICDATPPATQPKTRDFVSIFRIRHAGTPHALKNGVGNLLLLSAISRRAKIVITSKYFYLNSLLNKKASNILTTYIKWHSVILWMLQIDFLMCTISLHFPLYELLFEVNTTFRRSTRRLNTDASTTN